MIDVLPEPSYVTGTQMLAVTRTILDNINDLKPAGASLGGVFGGGDVASASVHGSVPMTPAGPGSPDTPFFPSGRGPALFYSTD